MIGVLRVAEIARELGCSERFLREGEKRGKLPKARRDLNGWRVYTQDDLEQLKKILIPSSEQQTN